MDISDELPQNLNPVFDPKFYKAAIQKIYGKHLKMLHEVRDWSIGIFQRAYASIERDAANLMILTVLFKQALISFDAAIICLEEGAINAAMVHVRGVFESKLYLEWILKGSRDSKYLGRQLYVATKRHERHILKRIIPGTKENEIYKKAWMANRGYYKNPDVEEVELAKEQVKKIDELLNNEVYREINESFDKLISKRNSGHEPYWYSPGKYGVSNLFKLAEKLKRLPEFVDQYYYMSLFSHGTVSFIHAYFLSNSEHQVEPIRNIEHFDIILQLVYHNFMFILDMIVKEYREGEYKDFNNHVEKWNLIMEELPKININVKGNYLI